MASALADRLLCAPLRAALSRAALSRAALCVALCLACQRGGVPEPGGEVSDEVELGRRFVAEREFRRAALERSLAMREEGDARKRLSRYGVESGWEALPILNPGVAPVVLGERPELASLWSGRVEWNERALLELGRRAFEEWPAQRAPAFTRLIGRAAEPPQLARGRLADVGAWIDDRGRVAGLVWAKYPDGTLEPALTCASCHARPDAAGRLQHGVASDLDLGALVGEVWGAGRVDVTVDARYNPVAVPDLRATRHQQRLHHAGDLRNSLEALAVRTETLLITARADAVRPPREIAFAIAYYVWSLGAQRPPAPPPSPTFSAACGGCHSGPTGAGDLVADIEVGTDGAATASSARGTGGYRVPSLYGVSERPRLMHLGWRINLRELLDPSRASRDMQGHPFGFDLSPAERDALVRELAQW
jgi:hypothetical protein